MVCLSVILLCYRITCWWFCNQRFCNKKGALFVLYPVYYIFCQSDKIISIILTHLHLMAVVVLAVVIFLFENLREKRSVALTKSSGIACFNDSRSAPVGRCTRLKIAALWSNWNLGMKDTIRLFSWVGEAL